MSAETKFEFPNQGLTVFLKFAQKDPSKMNRIIAQMGADEAWIRNEKNWHSREFFEDFLNRLVQEFGHDAVYQAGIHMFTQGQFKLGDSALGLLVSPQLLFSKLPAMVKRMNKYNTYVYQALPDTMTSQSCLLTQYCGSTEYHQFNCYMCDLARGSIEGSLRKLDYKLLSLNEEKCVKKGDKHCEYRVTWLKRTTLWSYIAAAIPFGFLAYGGQQGWLPTWVHETGAYIGLVTASVLIPAVSFWMSSRFRYRLTDIFDFQQQTLEQLQGILESERRLSQSLVDYQHHYQRAVRMATLGELSYGIVHDMASPLTILQIGSGSLAESGYNPKEIDHSVNMINAATAQLLLFQNLLRKTVRSGGSIEPCQVRVKQVVKDLATLFTTSARQKDITFETETDVPDELEIYGREDLLQRCLSNALQNAINALDKSEIKKISLRMSTEENSVVFEVIDSGPGIPSEILQRSTSGITQSRNNTGNVKGSGFGLFAMKKMVEEMHGRLLIETGSLGTTMKFVIPTDARTIKQTA